MERRRFLFSALGSILTGASAACTSRVQTIWEQKTELGRAITILPNGVNRPDSGSLALRFDIDRLPSGLDVVEGRIVIPIPFSVSVRRVVNPQGVPVRDYFDMVSVLTLGQEDQKIPARLFLPGGNNPGYNTFFVAWRDNQLYSSTGVLPNPATPNPGNRD